MERKDGLIRKAGNVGRRWTHVLSPPTPKILLSHASFSREKREGGNLSKTLRQEVGLCLHHSSLCANELTLPSDVILSL